MMKTLKELNVAKGDVVRDSNGLDHVIYSCEGDTHELHLLAAPQNSWIIHSTTPRWSLVSRATGTVAELRAEEGDLLVVDGSTAVFEVLRQLRLSRVTTPVLMLTKADSIESKIKAFGFGADDYLTKPFHREELVARIHAIVRRSKGHSQSVIQTGSLTVNLDAKTVEVKGKQVHLTGKEYQMLELLSLRKGTTLTKEMFLNHLYGGIDQPELRLIDVFICKLRKKLVEATGGQNYIETVWGRGYTLKD